MNLGPDGLLYVAEDAADMIHKLSPVTGAVLGSIPVNFPDNENSTPGLVVLPNGNILVGWETNGGVNYRIVEFESNGTELGNWLPLSTPGINVVRFLTLTPFGTVAFLNLHPNNGPNEIREYDATGSFLRIVIPVSEALRMYAFEFSSPAEILLSDLASNKIKRYNWASGSFVSDFANGPEPANNALWVTLDSRNGSVYGASHLNRCVYGWNAGGAPLYGGQPLACYNSGTVLYPGRMLVFTDAPIPAASEWGLAVTVLLIVTAGMIVFCKWHVPRMRGHALT